MKYLIGVFGLVLILGIAWLASNDRKKVKYRPIITMVILRVLQ
ncbi:Na+ dependent nucleoside transporter N-terminal domain-containing protein, partial [Bacillus thuringiensis]